MFTQEEAAQLLERAMSIMPTLNPSGVWPPRGASRSRWRGDQLREIALSADWLSRQRRIQSINTRHTSYTYKHIVERWGQKLNAEKAVPPAERLPSYVSNGSFIAAALGLGCRYKIVGPNVLLNLSEKTVQDSLQNDAGGIAA